MAMAPLWSPRMAPVVMGQHRWRRIVVALVALVAIVPALVLAVPSGRGKSGAATSPNAMPLQEFTNDGANSRLWNAYDETEAAAGPAITGRPSPLVYRSVDQVYTRAGTGDLVQYAQDNESGRSWNSYDLTTSAGGAQLAGDPTAVVAGSLVYIFALANSGDLVEYVNSGSGSQLWDTADITSLSGGPQIQGDVSVIQVGTTLYVFAHSAGNDLEEFVGAGAGTRTWSATDLTQVSDGPTIAFSPAAILYGTSSIHAYAISTVGDLTEFVNDDSDGHAWNAYDLTSIAQGPTGAGQPSPIVYGSTVHVYVDAGGQLTEFVNDQADHRLWNSYDLTSIAQGPPITGDPSAVFFSRYIVDIYAEGPGGDLVSYVNDGADHRLWNGYDLTQSSSGPSIGADPAAMADNPTVTVFAAGPLPPTAVNAIVSIAESQDQNHAGVIEDPPGSNCNIYTAYWGRGSATGCAPGTSAEEWCSDFAEWVWAQAGVDTTGIDGWAYSFVEWGQSHAGAWQPGDTNDPQPGDAVVWGDLSTGYGSHVGIVVGVSGGWIDVVSGNAGPPIDAAGDVDAVWDSGYFDPSTSTSNGYPIIGYVAPVGYSAAQPAAESAHALSPSQLAKLIAAQDGGK